MHAISLPAEVVFFESNQVQCPWFADLKGAVRYGAPADETTLQVKSNPTLS
jgi:hypothetical protein